MADNLTNINLIILICSILLTIGSMYLVFSIFKKVYEDKYRRPWVFIGFAGLLIGVSQILDSLNFFFDYSINHFLIEFLIFCSILFIFYGLFLENLILKFYKGKFVKFKFQPIKEGTLGGEIDLNVEEGLSYLVYKKDRDVIFKNFSKATKKGYEGFLLCEEHPNKIRSKFNLLKTPIAFITNSSNKEGLDENSDIVNPFELNNAITYIENFLEQSTKPFIAFELNLILKNNNYKIVNEFINFLKNRVSKKEGVLLFLINSEKVDSDEINEIKKIVINYEDN